MSFYCPTDEIQSLTYISKIVAAQAAKDLTQDAAIIAALTGLIDPLISAQAAAAAAIAAPSVEAAAAVAAAVASADGTMTRSRNVESLKTMLILHSCFRGI